MENIIVNLTDSEEPNSQIRDQKTYICIDQKKALEKGKFESIVISKSCIPELIEALKKYIP